MATIQKRINKGGSISYRVQIRRKHRGRVAHSETKSFTKLATAKAWASKREAELEDSNFVDRSKGKDCILNDAIDRYIAEVNPLKPILLNKMSVLKILQRYPIGAIPLLDQYTSERSMIAPLSQWH